MSSAHLSPDPHRLPDPSSTRSSRGPGGLSKLLMYVLLILAVAATIIMFFVDSDVWLNIAVIAALWAAFIGAVLVSRYSGALGEESSRSRERDARRLAELDAERAEHRRREAELEKAYAERGDTGRDETLESIRAELAALREQLSELSGLDLAEDQVAVRARAERIIELERRSGGAGENGRASQSPGSGQSPFGAPSAPSPTEAGTAQPGGSVSGAAASTVSAPSSAAPSATPSQPEPRQGGRRGGFATGTFSAVSWTGADSEETSMIPLVVDTRDDSREDESTAAPASRDTAAPASGTTGGSPAGPSEGLLSRSRGRGHHEAADENATGYTAPWSTAPTPGQETASSSGPSPFDAPPFTRAPEPAVTPDPAESGHHRRRRDEEPEDTGGRRRADDRTDANGSVTVAELMAQLRKNAK